MVCNCDTQDAFGRISRVLKSICMNLKDSAYLHSAPTVIHLHMDSDLMPFNATRVRRMMVCSKTWSLDRVSHMECIVESGD